MDAVYFAAAVLAVVGFLCLYVRERKRHRKARRLLAWREQLQEMRARRSRGEPVMPEWYDDEEE